MSEDTTKSPQPIKDMENIPDAYRTSISYNLSYVKTNKLITAMYMVTDTLDRDEPIRHQLRNLGVEIISDISCLATSYKLVEDKVNAVLSLLEVASKVRMISEMNYGILKNEFSEMLKSVNAYKKQRDTWLGDFLLPREPAMPLGETPGSMPAPSSAVSPVSSESVHLGANHKGHVRLSASSRIGHDPVRIGLQKGSTLLGALDNLNSKQNFLEMKKKRRQEIIDIIKKNRQNGIMSSTILDIRSKAPGSLLALGKKTLQRELSSMVHDGSLKRIGSKRWSAYSLP